MIQEPDEPEIVFADRTVIDALAEYVEEILYSLAEHYETPGMANAWVSDESAISDFACLDEERDYQTLKKVSADLGVPVSASDYVYEVAIRIRDK